MMMKRYSRTLALILLLVSSIHAQDSWPGIYEHTASFGKTTGGSPIVITYSIYINSDNSKAGAILRAVGYQTDESIKCETRTQGKRINLYFVSYTDESPLNKYGVRQYEKGDLLLSLERQSKGYRVTWGKYRAELKKRVLFIKR